MLTVNTADRIIHTMRIFKTFGTNPVYKMGIYFDTLQNIETVILKTLYFFYLATFWKRNQT
jgi:hypothetical protein